MNRRAGLTFLELLIVMMLLAFVAVLIGGAFDFVRQARERATALEMRQEQIILRGLLRGWVENMSPTAAENEFSGTPERFSFTLSDGLKAKPLAQVVTAEFRLLDPRTARLNLVGLDERGEEIIDESRVFESQLETATLAYYGIKNSTPPRWYEQWQEDHLPQLIRIEAIRGNGDPMPPMIIQPSVAYNQSLISVLFPSPPT